MKKTATSIKMGLLIFCFAFTAYSRIMDVLLFVNTAQGAIANRQATEYFEIMAQELAKEHGFNLTIQNGRSNSYWPSTFAKIPEADIILFANSGEPSFDSEEDQQVLINYFLNGGRAIGYHASADNSRYWSWWQDVLHSGADFNGHGNASFTLDKDPAVEANPALKKMWEAHELGEPTIEKTEIFKYTQYPRGKDSVTILQNVRPPHNVKDNHEFTWLREIGKGKYIYTALGTGPADFKGGWLQKATWAWMEYLNGKFDGKEGCLDKTATNYNSTATQACADCCQYPASLQKMELHPSPVEISSEKIFINFPDRWEVKVRNVNGETVLWESKRGVFDFSLSELQAGLYFVKVSSVSRSLSQRILIR